ncbi:hypothetical protein PENTCL1PPCAC_27891, partial [Pristionchus entomophagus]
MSEWTVTDECRIITTQSIILRIMDFVHRMMCVMVGSEMSGGHEFALDGRSIVLVSVSSDRTGGVPDSRLRQNVLTTILQSLHVGFDIYVGHVAELLRAEEKNKEGDGGVDCGGEIDRVVHHAPQISRLLST